MSENRKSENLTHKGMVGLKGEVGLPDLQWLRDLLTDVGMGKGLISACKGLKIAPAVFWELKAENEAVERAYVQAMELSGHSRAQAAIDTAMNATPETVAVDRLKVDTLKWAATRQNRREWGDRPAVAVTVNNAVRISDVISEAVEERITIDGES